MKVFEGQNYDIEGLREKITSGQLKNAVTETIRKQTATKTKTVRAGILTGHEPEVRRAAANNPVPGGAGIHH